MVTFDSSSSLNWVIDVNISLFLVDSMEEMFSFSIAMVSVRVFTSTSYLSQRRLSSSIILLES